MELASPLSAIGCGSIRLWHAVKRAFDNVDGIVTAVGVFLDIDVRCMNC